MIFDRLCTIYRLTKTADNNDKESFAADPGLIDIPINIQPAGAEDTILSDGVFAQTWMGFVVESGIRSGDKLTISGALTTGLPRDMVVKGVENWNFGDSAHLELTLTEFMETEIG